MNDLEEAEGQTELCPNQDHFKVLRSEVSPLLIAI